MQKLITKKKNNRGLTLIEALVTVVIFTAMVLSVYQVSATLVRLVSLYRESVSVSELANQYMEIIHNLPYSAVGTMTGNPHGSLPDVPNATYITFNGKQYQVYYVVNYLDDPADGTALLGTDPAPTDYKQVKLYIKNLTTGALKSFLTNITPKGLEGMSSGGALSVRVFDAVGQPVSGASINIVNTGLGINLTRMTDAGGNWVEVGLPASANGYHMVVTKTNYSSDQTYPASVGNPNPTKPDATILAGQVTQISFAIDQLSTLNFHTLDDICAPISNVGVLVRGSKLIGTPDILKFDNSYTSDAGGLIPLTNIEWDNYIPTLNSSSYMVYGTSPIQQVNVLPNVTQNFNMILGSKTDNSLLVIVTRAGTGAPIEGATVTLSPGSEKITGGSTWTQKDWSGGSGQADFTDETEYFAGTDVSDNEIPDGLRLFWNGVSRASSGEATSSSFDSGTSLTSYTTLTWQPTSQDPATTIGFQIATNNDNATWNYLGPDGTGNTYYTVSGNTINAIHNNNRYARYKVFFTTSDTSKTPVLSNVNLNYVSGCSTPGQVIFDGLTAGPGYSITVSLPGYITQTIDDLNISGNQVLPVLLSQ
ncbi:MAG: prepilin-type N-terminal cleavage/methylation domain-containing protein [Candidatus Pacebacteria bacterium]|nr:prepilin-type N-terminal cleavage/methylation domain-containing protein [Candidatus Paceibacterota bacterium]